MKYKYCKKCTQNKSCGNRHVYVIELKKSVINEKKYCRGLVRIKLTEQSKFYYVGETAHKPDCRYKQHVAMREGIRQHFICSCFGETKKRKFNSGNKGSKWVKDFHKKGGLRSSLFYYRNPVIGNQDISKKIEAEIARDLIENGHAAHFN